MPFRHARCPCRRPVAKPQGQQQYSFDGLRTVASPDYVRRDPEKSPLYQVVSQNLNTFLQVAEIEGKRLPKHVIQEFEAFLRCGILAYGFLRLQCQGCRHERLVAFSCKKRGICSSCGGRRMAETAANLVDHILPEVGVRQWVLSYPFQIRYLLARDSKIQSACLEIALRAITTFLKRKVRVPGSRERLQAGAVTLIQRFGGSINLNPHLHMVVLDGAYAIPAGDTVGSQPPRFHTLACLTDEDVRSLVKTIALRTVRYLKKKGHFQHDTPYLFPEDTESEEILPELQAASVQARIALGERKGQRVRRLGALDQIENQHAETQAPLCAAIQGFSLHAGILCAPQEREKLEKLARYVARPAVADERLRILPSGEIAYRLKREYHDGTSHLIFSPLELMEKLAALVPQPRIHLTRYHGCLGPHAKIRSLIVARKPEAQAPPQATADPANGEAAKDTSTPKPKRRMRWAELLARVFAIDMASCPSCGGQLKPIAAILEGQAITRILEHLGLPSRPPGIAPARLVAAVAYCED